VDKDNAQDDEYEDVPMDIVGVENLVDGLDEKEENLFHDLCDILSDE